jgi:hypothetical protein
MSFFADIPAFFADIMSFFADIPAFFADIQVNFADILSSDQYLNAVWSNSLLFLTIFWFGLKEVLLEFIFFACIFVI